VNKLHELTNGLMSDLRLSSQHENGIFMLLLLLA